MKSNTIYCEKLKYVRIHLISPFHHNCCILLKKKKKLKESKGFELHLKSFFFF